MKPYHFRQLLNNSGEGLKTYDVTPGVQPGTVLGPLLWSIIYDSVLRLTVPKQGVVVGFADDAGVVITSHYPNEVEIYPSETIWLVKSLLEEFGPKFAEQKTEPILFTN